MDALTLLPRQSPPPNTPDNGPLINTTGEKVGTALAIVLGVLIIVFLSWCCCCRQCGARHPPHSYTPKDPDLERATAAAAADPPRPPPQSYEMDNHAPRQPPHAVLPGYAGAHEDEIQADGRVPADRMFGDSGKDAAAHDPPPEYPGSPVQRPAELAARR